MEPLIWTTKGNVPESSLNLVPVWDVQDSYIKLALRYLDASGEVVKESCHVYDKTGVECAGVAANIGG